MKFVFLFCFILFLQLRIPFTLVGEAPNRRVLIERTDESEAQQQQQKQQLSGGHRRNFWS